MKIPLTFSRRTPKKARIKPPPQPRLTVGEYLLARLESSGITHIFSPHTENESCFLKLLTVQKNMHLVMSQACCDLAVGYARLKNKAAFAIPKKDVKTILSTLYHAAFESTPLLSIVLTEDTQKIEHDELKKTDLFSDFTIKSASEELEEATDKLLKKCFIITTVIDDPYFAAKKIDRAIDSALYYQKPVCIEIAESLVDTPIPPHIPQETRFPPSDPETLRDAALHIKRILEKAIKPFIAIGREVAIFDTHSLIIQFAEKLAIPICALENARGIIDETHPLFFGSYAEMLPPALKGSDTIFFFGAAKETKSKFAHTICIFEQNVLIDGIRYPHVSLFDITTQLAFAQFAEKQKMAFPIPKHYPFVATKQQKITAKQAVECIVNHIEDIIIVSNHPKVLTAISHLSLPQGSLISSKKNDDFSLPAAVGAAFTYPEKRLVAIITEKNLELSFSSLFTIAAYNINPIIIVLSEKKHTLPMHYKAIADLLGKGKIIHTISEDSFEQSFERALRLQDEFTLVDVVCGK